MDGDTLLIPNERNNEKREVFFFISAGRRRDVAFYPPFKTNMDVLISVAKPK